MNPSYHLCTLVFDVSCLFHWEKNCTMYMKNKEHSMNTVCIYIKWSSLSGIKFQHPKQWHILKYAYALTGTLEVSKHTC